MGSIALKRANIHRLFDGFQSLFTMVNDGDVIAPATENLRSMGPNLTSTTNDNIHIATF